MDRVTLQVTNALRDAVRPEGIYMRQGASTVPASETAILEMIKETRGDSYEEARSLNQQLTFEKAADYFESRNVAFGKAQMRTELNQ